MMYILQFAEPLTFPEGRVLLDAKLVSYLVKKGCGWWIGIAIIVCIIVQKCLKSSRNEDIIPTRTPSITLYSVHFLAHLAVSTRL